MTATIEDQLVLERNMVDLGVERYRRIVATAENKDRGSDTQYSQKILQTFILPVSKAIKEYCDQKGAGKGAKYRTLLRRVDPDKAALFGLKAILNHFTKDEPLASLGIKIGTMIEDELKFQKFHQQHEDYFEAIIRDFRNKGTKAYRHMHRVLTFKAREKGLSWEAWSKEERAAVGIKVVDLILENTDLITKATGQRKGSKKKTLPAVIRPTEQMLEWVGKFKSYSELLYPDRVPCIIPPDPWVDQYNGGYYSPQLRYKTPLVKTRSAAQRTLLEAADMSVVMEAVNAAQSTAWEVNSEVYDVLKLAWDKGLSIGLPSSIPVEMPTSPVQKKKKDMTERELQRFEDWKNEARIVHSMEKERVAKCFQVIRVLRLARQFEGKPLWFVYQCDFRGRMYCASTGLSPQGADFGKALLRFHEGKPLTDKGVPWFKIHGANMYGVDKVPYMDRIKWVDENSEMFLRIAEDPIRSKALWADADKPWQFLAWCLEYARFIKDGEEHVSHIPISLDGTCNGLQNFSAMLRDEVGGKATNLTPADTPADIYTEVAGRATEILRERMDASAMRWKEYLATVGKTIPRGLAKRPVMTLPYGSTRQSCREYIYKFMYEDAPFFDKKERFALSVYLTPILWKAINDVVIAAREAMDWLQQCASALAKEDTAILWYPPNGFPVYMDRRRVASRQIHTELAGHFRIRLDVDTDKIDTVKQKLGIAPNFVHSMDACHLHFTVQKAKEKGITGFALIHDDYGTHACDTPKLHSCIRSAFVEMYGENDPLLDFKTLNETSGISLPDMPEKGSLVLENIKNSRYFFG